MNGRALLGGVNGSPALLIDTNGALTKLPVHGEGPVGWTPEGVPVQFTAISNVVVLRDAANGKTLREFPLPPARQLSAERPTLTITPAGTRLAAVRSNHLVVWEASTGERLGEIAAEASALAFNTDSRALAFDREGRRLVFGGEPGAGGSWVGLWKIEPHRGIQVLRGLRSSSRKVWFSSDSQSIAALSDDWHLAFWEVASGHLRFIIETPVGVLADNAGGCFDANGKRFAFAAGNNACLYDVNTGEKIQRWVLNNGLLDLLQFDTRGRLLLLRRERGSAGRNSIWRLFELAESEKPILLRQQDDLSWQAGA